MKQLNIILEDKEFKELTKKKEDKTWREYLLSL